MNVRLPFWVCDRCADPETGQPPLVFADAEVSEQQAVLIQAAWQEKYGEPLPPRQPPGRKPEELKEERVQVLFTASELARLDRVRGEKSRSEFIREWVLKAS